MADGRIMNMAQPHIRIPEKELAELCRRNQIRRLALFGSVLREDFKPDSDVDVLVDFEPEAQIGFLALGRIQRELSDLLKRKVDLVLRDGIKPIIRESVLLGAQDIYAT